MRVVDTILPIILIMLLGFAMQKRGWLQGGFIAGLNSFVYWIAMPILIVRSLLADALDWSGVGTIFGLLALSTIIVFLLGWLLVRSMKVPAAQAASFLQGAFRGNLALIGLPMLLFLQSTRPDSNAVTGILVLSPSILAYNVSSVLLFARMVRQEQAGSGWFRTLLSLRTNPLILATLLGFSLALTGWTPPGFATRFLDMVGGTAAPLALICIGANMADVNLSGRLKLPLLASLLKTFVLPIVALGLGWALGLSQDEMFVLLLYAACPTAAASAILARQMGGDDKMSSFIVAISTSLSLIPLSLVVYWF